MRRQIVVAALTLVLATAAGVAWALKGPPRVPPRGTEGPDIRITEGAPHRPCPETEVTCSSGGRGVEGPETR